MKTTRLILIVTLVCGVLSCVGWIGITCLAGVYLQANSRIERPSPFH